MLRLICVTMSVGGGLIAAMTLWPGFFHLPTFLGVFGGAVAVTVFSYSKAQIHDLAFSLRALFINGAEPGDKPLEDLKRLSHLYRLRGARGLESQEEYISDPFLKLGVSLVVDFRREHEIQNKLENEHLNFLNRQETSRQILLTLGKLLPSFGLIGTLIGFVLLLQRVSDQGAQNLPAALSVAVLTTLYGAVLANLVVLPLAAKLQSATLERESVMRLIMDWIGSLTRNETANWVVGKTPRLLLSGLSHHVPDKGWPRAAVLPER